MNEDDKRIIRLDAVRRDKAKAEREAAEAARRAARPPREGIAPVLYWGVVLTLIFALAGGYALVQAL